MTTGWSRLTVVGTNRRADVVLPSDEQVGRLMPDVFALLDAEPVGAPGPRGLVTSTGVAVAGDRTLEAAGVRDGATLRLVPLADAPPPPVVHDVTEAVSDDLAARPWRWGPRARRWTATAVLAVLAWSAGLLAANNLSAGDGLVAVAGLAAVLLASGVAASLLGVRPLGTALTLAGGAVALLGAWQAPVVYGWPVAVGWGAVVAVAALTLLVLGSTSALRRAGLVGGASLLALVLAWGVGAALELSPPRLAAVMAVVSVVLLGLLPRLALVSSGLSGLDDRSAAGATVPRDDVATAVAAAHRGLLVATVAAAACAAVAAGLLLGNPDPYTVALAGTVGVVLAARSRTFPLAAEVAVLLAAAVSVLLLGLDTWAASVPGFPSGPLAVLLVAATPALVVLAVDVPDHVRARLRGAGDKVEALAVLAVVPLAVGVFGVFERLLQSF